MQLRGLIIQKAIDTVPWGNIFDTLYQSLCRFLHQSTLDTSANFQVTLVVRVSDNDYGYLPQPLPGHVLEMSQNYSSYTNFPACNHVILSKKLSILQERWRCKYFCHTRQVCFMVDVVVTDSSSRKSSM